VPLFRKREGEEKERGKQLVHITTAATINLDFPQNLLPPPSKLTPKHDSTLMRFKIVERTTCY
jgi:hypothetical protein